MPTPLSETRSSLLLTILTYETLYQSAKTTIVRIKQIEPSTCFGGGDYV